MNVFAVAAPTGLVPDGITAAEATVIVALISGLVTLLVQRMTSKDKSKETVFEQVQAWTQKQLEERDRRIDSLQEQVREVREESARWKRLLIVSVDHIIDLRKIIPGDSEIPATPHELDDIILDRSVSRYAKRDGEK